MLEVTVLAVGKLKEAYLRSAIAEYEKRLSAFCKFLVVEIPEAKLPLKPSEAEITRAMEDEGKDIAAKIPARSKVISLCIEGKQISSEDLAVQIESFSGESSKLIFVIGSSHGLSDKVKHASDIRLSMSKMTFPHQLARVMVTEQIYRALAINNNSKYHK